MSNKLPTTAEQSVRETINDIKAGKTPLVFPQSRVREVVNMAVSDALAGKAELTKAKQELAQALSRVEELENGLTFKNMSHDTAFGIMDDVTKAKARGEKKSLLTELTRHHVEAEGGKFVEASKPTKGKVNHTAIMDKLSPADKTAYFRKHRAEIIAQG